MENPKCPYCGEEQYLTIEDHREIGRMEYYMCIHCGSRSPAKTTTEEAYAAAMKRDRAKGEWIYKERHEHYPSGKKYTARYCGVCGRRDHNEDSDYCGYCGAEMRKEANDDER